jgi:hypothetical protein
VSEYLSLKGEWSSPGGERETFTDGSMLITWWKNKKLVSLNGLGNNILSKLKFQVCKRKVKEDFAAINIQQEIVTTALFLLQVNSDPIIKTANTTNTRSILHRHQKPLNNPKSCKKAPEIRSPFSVLRRTQNIRMDWSITLDRNTQVNQPSSQLQ